MVLYIVATPIGNLEDITLRAIRLLFSVPIILCEDTRRTGNMLEWYRKNLEFPRTTVEFGTSRIQNSEVRSQKSEVRIQNTEVRKQMAAVGSDKSVKELHPGDDHNASPNIRVLKLSTEPGRDADSSTSAVGRPRLISFYEHNEQKRIEEVMGYLKQGMEVALVTNAGTPLVSDPGFKLVREALKRNIRVVSIPGASAWLAALTSSGMPTDRVLFLGYLSPRERRRKKELHQLKEALSGLRKSPTLVMYESPHRLVICLKNILEVAGNVELVLAKELTKLHEKVEKKPVSLWVAELGKMKKIKGEYTLVWRF